ncbi:MAG: Large extracellular alpha-helical protein [Acidobacteria bacterium]|nr:Large extracellular alpha-helical protein [Acidobacteriota bacterium]
MPFISIVLTILSFFPVPGRTFFAMAGAATSPTSSAAGYESLKRQAEGAYEEKSYQRAHDFYEQVAKLELAAADRRWVTFRLADTAWRVDAADPSPDQEKRDQARKELETLISESGEEHDRVWAEANESLADEWWLHPQLDNYGTAQPFYAAALDWWGGSGEVDLARRRYLAIVFRLAAVGRYGGRWQGEAMENASVVPHDVLVNALAIATDPQDRAHARFLLGTQLLATRRTESVERGLELLDGVIGEGKGTPWYDDALFAYAQQLSDQGRVIVLESGDPGFKHDYAKAVELFLRIVALGAEQTRFYEQAKRSVDDILQPSVSAMVPGNFLPGSEQEVIVPWRNLKEVELTVTAVDLTRDVDPALSHRVGWAQAIKTEGRPVIRRWKVQTSDIGDHTPGVERVRMTPPLAPGAYVIAAGGGEKTAHQLFLVSDLNVLTHALNGKTAVFVSNVVSGEPVAGASVRLWQQDGNLDVVRDTVTNAEGLAVISESRGNGTTVVAASSGAARQAYLSTYSYASAPRENDRWRIYAFTDRSAYRPGDTVHWKMTARVRDESRWTTPAHAKVQYEIVSPRDEKVASGEAVLNEFGSFWADLPLIATMPLGGYEIVFRTMGDTTQAIGSAPLFALEEYKLPEFRVSVTTPVEEGGKRKLYRLGDKVEATIEASYYFGGPVASATVEVVVTSEPFYRSWFPWREYDWYYENDRQRNLQPGTEVKM